MIFSLNRNIHFGLINLTVHQRGIGSLLQLYQNHKTGRTSFFFFFSPVYNASVLLNCIESNVLVWGAILSFTILTALFSVAKGCTAWKDATVPVSLLPVQINKCKGLWGTSQGSQPPCSPQTDLFPRSLVLKHVLCTNHPSGKLQNYKGGSLMLGQSNSSVDSLSSATLASKHAAYILHFCMKSRRKYLQLSVKLMNYGKEQHKFRTIQS